MDSLSVDHLLGIKYLKKLDIDLIFKTADRFKEVLTRPIKKVPSLRHITVANIFFENRMDPILIEIFKGYENKSSILYSWVR